MPLETGTAHRILVVDDEPDITALVAYHLAKDGYRVTTAANGAEALRSAREERPDLVVLDLMLPGLSGYDVLAELRRREETRDVGVILLTARKEEPDRIKGLSLGADDYLAKPFSPQELVLRVAAVLRRLAAPPVATGGRLTAGPITLDRGAHRVTVTGKEIELTATEFKLLDRLIERRDRVQSRTQLLESVWQAQPDIQTRTVDMHVQRLRAKLGGAGPWIETIRGVGYRFREPSPPPPPTSPGALHRPPRMKLATRLFASMSLLVAAAVAGSILATDVVLRRYLEAETAAGLEGEARLLATLAPADSGRWAEFARLVGKQVGRRVTLIDPEGRVRGDTEFDRAALPRLENHASRPEVRSALATGGGGVTGRDARVSASTNERQLYVAVRGGPAGLAVVRVSASLAAVDARVHGLQRAVAGAGLAMLAAAALVAWLLARALARPLLAIAAATRDVAAGRPAAFPDPRIPELARHVDALRAMHQELERRFAALRREREASRTLLESLTDGVIATDDRGAIVSANGAARRLLGYGPADPLPPLPELFHDQSHRALVRDGLEGRPVERRELELGDRSVLASAHPLEGGGTLLVLSDVTDVRRLEAVRRDFVANVSHELKTPLTSIAGYAETLAAEAADGSPASTFANTIVESARRMQRLVDDLLDLSRIESGGWRPQPRVVEVEAAARDAWTPFADRATAGRVRFAAAVAAEAHALVVDPDALRQIFTNLFDNALRHTPAGGSVRLTAELTKDGIVLGVTDTGPGIPAEHLPRIFERFYRVDPGRARQQGGTGLGLAIVKHLVEAHGGRVEAESAVGRGTTIRMHFPATPVSQR